MNCQLEFRTAEANAKKFLRERNIIDYHLNILDLKKFRGANKYFAQYGKDVYGIEGRWFYEDQDGTKAVPNRALFKKVDEKNGVFYALEKGKDNIEKLFKNKSTVLIKAGEDSEDFYIDLLKTIDNGKDRYFVFSEGQSPWEVTKEEFAEHVERIQGEVATTEEKDRFVKDYLKIADIDEVQRLDTEKETELKERIQRGLADYSKNNNIKIEFNDMLFLEYGNDATAVFDSINGVIKINQNRAGIDTLPEEISHHLVEALGPEHTLVKRAVNLANRYGIREILGSEYDAYNNAYNGNQEKLTKEAIGKLISKAVVNRLSRPAEFENGGVKLWDTIVRLIDKFISLFKPNDNIMNELKKASDELADIIVKGKDVSNGRNIKPEGDLFQLDTEPKEKSEMLERYKKQIVFFKRRMEASKIAVGKLKKEIQTAPDTNRILKDIKYHTEIVESTRKSLDELVATDNDQILVNLINKNLKRIENSLNALEKGDVSEENVDSIENIKRALDIFKDSDIEEVVADVSRLKKRLRPILRAYVKMHINKVLDRAGKPNEVHDDDIDKVIKDVFVGDWKFGTLSDVSDVIAKTIGVDIKNAQSEISNKKKESFDKVSTAVEKLRKYQSARGVAEKDTYDIFIQEQGDTTVLTRPYTAEFYKDIADTYQYGEEGIKMRHAMARRVSNDKNGEKWIPLDTKRYTNPKFQKIKDTPELMEFYTFFRDTIDEAFSKLPVGKKRNFIPNVIEHTLIDILKSDKKVGAKLSEGIKHITDMQEGEDVYNIDESLDPDKVPMKYIKAVDPSIKSRNLGDSLLKFLYFVDSYEVMSEVLPRTRLLQEIIAEKQYERSYGKKTTKIDGENTHIYKFVNQWIDMQVKGNMKNEEDFQGVRYDKILDFGLRYTSLLRIGLNPFNAFANVVIGKISNWTEANGGRFFTKMELHKAENMFWASLGKKDNKVKAFIKIFNPLMELEDYENLEKLTPGSSIDKAKSLMYMPQKMGERYLQSTTMIANLMHDSIEAKDGTKVKWIDAFKEDGTWDEQKMGFPLTKQLINKRANKIKRINAMIHGRYSAQDAATITQSVWGRIALQFKKWIPAAIESRFGERKFDDVLEVEMVGRWRTWIRWAKLMAAKARGDAAAIAKNKMTEADLYNMRKNYMELAMLIGVVGTFLTLKNQGTDDDELKRNTAYKIAMLQLDRAIGDITFFADPSEMNKSIFSAFALSKTVRDLANIIDNVTDTMLGEDPTYTKGIRKGENKILASIVDVTPVLKPIIDVWRTSKKDVVYESPKDF